MKKTNFFLKTVLTIILFGLLSVYPSKTFSQLDTVVISSIQDNTLYEDANGLISNGQGKYMFAGKYSDGKIRRAALRFLLVEFLPQCSKIVSVSLKVHLSGGNAANKTIQLRKINESWGEGSSDAPGLEETGTTSTSYDATWKHTYYNTDFWSTTGGSYSNIVSQSAVIGAPGYYTFASTPGMVSDAQQWLDDNSKSFGWMLIGDEVNNSSAKRFHTSEADTLAFVPELTIVYQPAKFTLYMEAMIEGFWDGNTMVEDTLKVKLRNSFSPYAVVDSDQAYCGQYGGNFCFFNANTGNYYIQVNHRNSIETWSKLPVLFTVGNYEYYDFTDLVTKAYGDNEILKFNEYCMYSGDENQDGNIDVVDIIDIFNDLSAFTSGYVDTDITGDDFVDSSDLLLAFNNSNNLVTIMRP